MKDTFGADGTSTGESIVHRGELKVIIGIEIDKRYKNILNHVYILACIYKYSTRKQHRRNASD